MNMSTLTEDYKERKDAPICTGVLDYFAPALFEVAKVSKIGNDQHNPGQPLHWAWGKSNDHADCIIRHLADRGTFDKDGARHSAKVAWRALALLVEELVAEGLAPLPRAAWVAEQPAVGQAELTYAPQAELTHAPGEPMPELGPIRGCLCIECSRKVGLGIPYRS